MVEFNQVSYGGWENCYQLTNGRVELIITTDVGPRIIRFGFVGQHNEFAEFDDMLGETGGEKWRIYGGHRLWHAPEHPVRTYYPDNQPVKIRFEAGTVYLTQDVEQQTHLQKEIDITLDPDSAQVTLVHRLINHGDWGIECAPWSLSVMAQGGLAITPHPSHGTHSANLLPATQVILWSYTSMADPRWTWGHDFVFLRQDPTNEVAQKAGFANSDGWLAYSNKNHLFIKRFDYQVGATYPDAGSSAELFTEAGFLELETLAPLNTLAPGGTATHEERWELLEGVPNIETEDEARQHIWPLVGRV